MRRLTEIITGRPAKTFSQNRKILQNVLLGFETVEELLLELAFLFAQLERPDLKPRSGKELAGCHYPRAVKITGCFNNHRSAALFLKKYFASRLDCERCRVVVRMSSLVGVRDDQVRLQFQKHIDEPFRDGNQIQGGFLVCETKGMQLPGRDPGVSARQSIRVVGHKHIPPL
jgi:hypothetical protein